MNKNYFISYEQALSLVLKRVKPGKTELINVNDACGFVIAKDVRSPNDSPPFNNSAMDGYAFKYSDYLKNNGLNINGESSAGASYKQQIKKGQAVRIFTGAPVPSGCDTVVMQEKVDVTNSILTINDKMIRKGSNIRLKGSQSKKGTVLLKKHKVVTPGTIGLLNSVGVNVISVYSKPKVSIIVTGNELVAPGKKLCPGQIFESNASVLRSASIIEGVLNIDSVHVIDNEKEIQKAFDKAIKVSDIILFTGGISVGDYDFTGKVLDKAKVKTQFYKVKQKPGKPLYFGIKSSKYIFALPGNPGSVLTCFYEYVVPAIRSMQQHPVNNMRKVKLPIISNVTKKKGLTVFYKAFTDLKSVKILPGQESYKMNSFSEANCFVVLSEKDESIVKGELVNVQLFS